MKKMLKFMVSLAALVAMLGFVSCSSDDDEDTKPTSTPTDHENPSDNNPTTPEQPIVDENDSFAPITVFDGTTMTAITDLPSSVERIDENGKQQVDANKKNLNNKNFTYRFKFGGKDSLKDGTHTNALKISTGTTSPVKVIVYAMSSSKTASGTVMAMGDGDEVTLLINGGESLAASEEISVTPDKDKNIYVYASGNGNAMNIYYLYISQ